MTKNIWQIPSISGEHIELELEDGKQFFVVGANGSGKSALLQHCVFHLYPHFYPQYQARAEDKYKWIMGHRQIWFESGSVSLTPDNRLSYGDEIRHNTASSQMRWKNDFQSQNIATVLFDVVAKDHDRNRQVTAFFTEGDYTETKGISPKQIYDKFGPSPLEQINELFKIGGFMTQLEYTDAQGFRAHHENGANYGIEQMSDGERNAMIIASQVITATQGCVLLIDEPERHLHRAIIVPFLMALFEHRRDCVFVISTHEVALPVATPDAEVLMLRSCQWQDEKCERWDVVHLDSTSKLPEELKLAILGAREKILFVEGESTSLDCPLYTALYPKISVRPVGSCMEVENAVRVLRKTRDTHRIDAFGLIDRDNRKIEDIAKLQKVGIFALDVYSVEELYYCSEVIEAVAVRQAELLDGRDADQLIRAAKREAFKVLDNNENGLDERMAKYRRDRQVVLHPLDGKMPEEKTAECKDNSIDVRSREALDEYREAVNNRELDSLVARYPLKQSSVFEVIAKALECRNRHNYESMVVAQIKKNGNLKATLKKRLEGLSKKLDEAT